MTTGKVASQLGHAFVGAVIEAQRLTPTLLSEYHSELPHSPGTKICLVAKDLNHITQIHEQAKAAGITCFLVVDSGCKNFFDGEPIVTAIGLGPAKRHQVKPMLKRCELL